MGERPASEPDEVAATSRCPSPTSSRPYERRIETGIWRGRQRRTYVIQYGEFRIWGVTAGIVNNLDERLFP